MKNINEFYVETDEINLDYRRLMLSFLKNALQRSDTQLFEAMYGTGVTKEKNFAFDIRLGRVQYLPDCVRLTNDKFTWEIVTPDYALGIDIYNALLNMKNVKYPAYNGNNIILKKSQMFNHKHYESESVLVRFCSGLCVRRHVKGEKDRYFLYDDVEFEEQLLCNLKLQLKDSGITDFTKFSLTPVNAKKIFSKTMGIVIPNSIGVFRLTGSTELINYLYQSGIGSRRNHGFGVFEIIG